MLKHVGTAYYVHKSNVSELIKKVVPKELQPDFYCLLHSIDYAYAIIKYDGNNVTFISSPDFLTVHEPLVGYCYRYRENEWKKPPKVRKDFKRVYHHRWMFVASDFDGFDVEKEKARTKLLNSLNLDKKRIGNKNYWNKILKEYKLEV